MQFNVALKVDADNFSRDGQTGPRGSASTGTFCDVIVRVLFTWSWGSSLSVVKAAKHEKNHSCPPSFSKAVQWARLESLASLSLPLSLIFDPPGLDTMWCKQQ